MECVCVYVCDSDSGSVCVCLLRVRLIGVNRDNLSLRALQDPRLTIMILCRPDEWQESF